MKSVLLTGAAGFIGSRTAQLLLDSGRHVVGVDNMNDYYDPRLKQHRRDVLQSANPDRFDFAEIDIERREPLEELFEKHDFGCVINLAARAGVRYSMENPTVYLQTNAQGTLNLLELMKDREIRKFVLASTSSLYAGQPMPFTEDMPVNEPISPYAASKKAAEAMAYAYHHLYDFDVTVVRYFTVYGPAGRPDMSPFRFIKWIDEGTPLTLFGDGTQSRDFTHVDDIARGTLEAMAPVGYEIVNIGGGKEPVNLLQLIEMIENKLGKKAEIDFQPAFKSDMKDTSANIEKAKRLWGWQPRVGLEEGIGSTVAWWKENHDWVKDLPV